MHVQGPGAGGGGAVGEGGVLVDVVVQGAVRVLSEERVSVSIDRNIMPSQASEVSETMVRLWHLPEGAVTAPG